MSKGFYKKKGLLVLLIFLVALTARLYFSFSHANLDYNAYFSIREIENIKGRGIPIFNDRLSYSGNFVLFSPPFYYIIALFSFFLKARSFTHL